MAGTTYSKFFWQDWHGDDEVASCSLAAQGLWMRLLCRAARSTTPGHVLLNGRKPSTEELRDACRLKDPQEVIEALLAELISKGVCDLTREGVIVSRRMVRDARRRQISSKGGKSRQRQIAETNDESLVGTRRLVQPPSTINQNPSTINHPLTPKGEPPTLDEQIDKLAKIGRALGCDLTTHPRGPRLIRDMIELEQSGLDLETDLIPTIRELREGGRVPKDLGSLMYFRKAAMARKEARELGVKVAEANARTPFEDTDAAGWKKRLMRWLDTGWWPPSQGARPRSGKCCAPPVLLESALERWREQGGHPQNGFCEDARGYRSWANIRTLRRDPDCDYGDGPTLRVVAG